MPGKILVADDSPNIREILKISLEGDGYSVVLAEDGEQALERVAQEKPDLLIMDVMMPKVNGFQVCRRVKTDPSTHEVPRQRNARGDTGQIVHFEWDPRAMDVFRKKYGEFKLSEAYKRFRAATEKFLKEHDDP